MFESLSSPVVGLMQFLEEWGGVAKQKLGK
jgi:hypothetical protein